MKIGITGNNGDLCLGLINYLEERFGNIDKFSLHGDEWKNRKFDYDVLIHIAGVTPKPGVTKEQYFLVNTDLSEAVAKKSYEEGTKHIIVFSTMAVYGVEPSMAYNGGIIDSYTKCNPCTDYGISKLKGEESFRKYENDNFKVTYLRIPSVYYYKNTSFINVAVEMYYKFPKFYPKLASKQERGAIFAGNVFECVVLIILRKQYGVVCPQDAPLYSVYDYMTIINEKHSNIKKSSYLLGLAVRMIMFAKPEWKIIFGQIKYEDELANILNGDYRIYNNKEELVKSIG